MGDRILLKKCLRLLLLVGIFFIAGCNNPTQYPEPSGIIMEVSPEGIIIWRSLEYKIPTSFSIDKNGNKIISDKALNMNFMLDKNNKKVWVYMQGDKEYIEKTFDGNFLLISETLKPSIVEVNEKGNVLFKIENQPAVGEIHKLKNGNYLLASRIENVIKEIDKDNNVIWQSKNDIFRQPYSVQLLDNGNYLVADFDNHRIVEINKKSDIVWQSNINLSHPISAKKLKNGLYAIADKDNGRVIFMEKNGNIIEGIKSISPRSVIMLDNGNLGIAGSNIE